MPIAQRSRVVEASPASVWRVVDDLHRQPAWWPRVARVEGASARGFTQVLRSSRGRDVRADQTIVKRSRELELTYDLKVAGTVFEKAFRAVQVSILLERTAGDGTKVTLVQRQRMAGMGRFGGFMARRAAKRTLDAALDALVPLVTES